MIIYKITNKINGKALGINVGQLHQAITGKRNKAKGYTFSKVLK